MAKYDARTPEGELKGKVAADWFAGFDCTPELGRIDFCVAVPCTDLPLCDAESVLWAEAKKGVRADLYESFVQLILTIGKERTHERYLPPKFLGAFDAEKIAFLPYNEVFAVFVQNDFNWNVAPSDHDTKEFRELHARVKGVIEGGLYRFDFERDERELRGFIKRNFALGAGKVNGIRITKNNFTHIYLKWRETVMPTIAMPDWTLAKKNGIIDADFFLADILSSDNLSITKRLNVLLMDDRYRQGGGKNILGQDLFTEVEFKDRQVAHRQFWNRYRRPPAQEYWDYIINRRDLLVPQDVRERKGSFFTPRKWVELSQHYLERELGENWQDEYVVWDCCAGTGNLLAGLTNKYRIWASTLDQQDVDAMRQRIDNGANLLDSHVFRFDFLNDPFDKLPDGLREIVADPEKRKKLVIYINPPYAEGDSRVGHGRNISEENYVTRTYGEEIGYGKRELFVLFLARIYKELNGCVLGEFSKLKLLQAPKFDEVRKMFAAELTRMFIVPANTFDNVKGEFPIGFKVWRTMAVGAAPRADRGGRGATALPWPNADAYDRDGYQIGSKSVLLYDGDKVINDWVETFVDKVAERDGKTAIATLLAVANDFQHQNTINISDAYKPWNHQFQWQISASNVIQSAIYFSVRLCMEATWLNDRDQFLYPNDGWKLDSEFQGDCLVYALFHGQNRISREHGVNHWIPFTEQEVGAGDCFASHFMGEFLKRCVWIDAVAQQELDFAEARNMDCAARLAYYHAHELGRTWYEVADAGKILAMATIAIFDTDETADRKAVKEIFRRMKPVRNLADGRMVSFPVAAAKKLRLQRGINVPGIASKFGCLFARSIPVWSEKEAEIPNHKRHRNAYAYHHYLAKMAVGGGEYYIRFAVREDTSTAERNELHDAIISNIVIYKAKGAELSGPGLSRVEDSTPFVDNKIALFLSIVNWDGRAERRFAISPAAQEALDAGRELWRYYHALPDANPNASYYDIRKRFQGVKVTASGKEQMNATSGDEGYNERLAALKQAMRRLAGQIQPKVYAYGFLRK